MRASLPGRNLLIMEDSWTTRDLPVLRKIIDVMASPGTYANEGDLIGTANLDRDGVRSALVSLDDQGLIVKGELGLGGMYVEEITSVGYARAR